MKKSTLPIILFVFSSLLISLNAEVSDKTDRGYVLPKDKLPADGSKLRSIGFEPARFIDGSRQYKEVESFYPYQKEESYGNYLLKKVPDEGLTEKGKLTVDIAPAWLRHDLADVFKRIGIKQDRWADLIIAHEGQRYIDELIFTIAHTNAWFLKQLFADRDAYIQNVQSLYEIDAELDYVEIVDYGTPGVDDDYYSTTKYWTMRNGEKVQVELEREYYYWYIVHPKLESEDPSIGVSGKFWREYLFYDVEGERSYRTFWVLKKPNLITLEDVSGWRYFSYGYLTGFKKFVWNVIKDAQFDRPVLTCIPWRVGAVLATVLPLEKGDFPGQEKLLENCINYGNGEMSVMDMKWTPSDNVKIAIIKDRDPWGVPSVENMCNKLGFTYEVYSSADLDSWNEITTDVEKIIIPSDQTRSFYETIARNKKKIEVWLEKRNILEFHGACQASEDWSDLVMPGDFTRTSPLESANDEFKFSQYPLLKDALKMADVVWDENIGSLPAGREYSNCAIDNLGNWQGQVKFYWARSYQGRSNQPEFIAFRHDGNCGETHDLLGAAGRIALIPFNTADGAANDHVWNEFYENGWHFYDVGREGGPSNIAYPGGRMDKDVGGSGSLPMIARHRPDTYDEDVTEDYTSISTLIVNVNDVNGYPVDGAIVYIFTEYCYPEVSPYISILNASTDSKGTCSFNLGDNRNFFVRVESPIGKYPSDDSNDVVQIISKNVPDRTYYWGCNLSGTIKRPTGKKIEPPSDYTIFYFDSDLIVQNEILYGLTNGLGYSQPSGTGSIDYFIMNASNLRKYLNSESFEAYEIKTDTVKTDSSFYIPYEDAYFVVLSNDKRVKNAQEGVLKVNYNREAGPTFQTIESVSTNFKLHPGERMIVSINDQAPLVLAAGFYDSQISESAGGELLFKAFVMDTDGYGDIEEVELVIDGERQGKFFKDDGLKKDETAGDSLFTLNIPFFPNSIEKGLHKKYGLIAEDYMGKTSTIWPQLHVENEVTPALTNQNEGSELFDESITSLIKFQTEINQYENRPLILGGGFGDTSLTTDGGLLKFYAILPEGTESSTSVQILYDTKPTGIYLDNTGFDFSLLGGRVYAFNYQFSSFPAGDYIFELHATDRQANKSVVFPYFEVGE